MRVSAPPAGKDDIGFVLNRKTYAAFSGREGNQGLPDLCLALLADQKEGWPDLRDGIASLKGAMEREIACRGFSVRLQYNPGRIQSSLAGVEEKNAGARECFLCLSNLPESQKGILYKGEYLVLCNPAPVFPAHFTIAHVTHRPQSIRAQIETFLQLIHEFGPEWTVFYNGPRCGASAPGHLHFQVIPSGKMPVEHELRDEKRLTPVMQGKGSLLFRAQGMGREIVIVEGDNILAVARSLKRVHEVLQETFLVDEEPMMNIAGFYERGKWRLLIFPRRKHRPDAFYREGDGRVVVSPGLIDMGGLLITPVKKDFDRLDAAALEGIYQEVSLETPVVEKAIARFGDVDD